MDQYQCLCSQGLHSIATLSYQPCQSASAGTVVRRSALGFAHYLRSLHDRDSTPCEHSSKSTFLKQDPWNFLSGTPAPIRRDLPLLMLSYRTFHDIYIITADTPGLLVAQ
jgi:hypothetical protein